PYTVSRVSNRNRRYVCRQIVGLIELTDYYTDHIHQLYILSIHVSWKHFPQRRRIIKKFTVKYIRHDHWIHVSKHSPCSSNKEYLLLSEAHIKNQDILTGKVDNESGRPEIKNIKTYKTSVEPSIVTCRPTYEIMEPFLG